jgi:hypothetical protein
MCQNDLTLFLLLYYKTRDVSFIINKLSKYYVIYFLLNYNYKTIVYP